MLACDLDCEKAFQPVQPYQFPGRTAVSDNTYEVAARIPSGTTEEQFSGMLQGLLKERFGLAWHFQEKKMKGYRLVIAKDGPKLKESSGAAVPAGAGQHSFGQGEGHNHSGPMVFGTSATYRATNRTTAELARMLSDQIGFPVDDETGLKGKYDISLRWSGNEAANGGNHGDGGHAGHEGGGGPSGDASGPTLFDALGQQLGLRLVSAEQAVARLFVIDKVAQRPTEN